MSILVNRNTRLLVQGITGKEGSYHAERSAEYGANLVAGVTPGKGGQTFTDTVPVYDTVQQAVDETHADASLIFVPPAFAADAIAEAVDAGITDIAIITGKHKQAIENHFRSMPHLESALEKSGLTDIFIEHYILSAAAFSLAMVVQNKEYLGF